MGRTLLCSLAGAVVGFLVGFAGVSITSGAQPASDTGAAILFVGSFLAGTCPMRGPKPTDEVHLQLPDLQRFHFRVVHLIQGNRCWANRL